MNDAIKCIRDGGSWYSCPGGYRVEDFVKEICQSYVGTQPPEACLPHLAVAA